MSKIEFENPDTTEQFKAMMDKLSAPLPWSEDAEGSVSDANGKWVLQIDPNDERDYSEVETIASYAVLAINTCGGFKAERTSEKQD